MAKSLYQVGQLQQDYAILQARLKVLLNTTTDVEPDDTPLENACFPVAIDRMRRLKASLPPITGAQEQTSLSRYKLEKSRLLPDLLLGYNNMTMRGMESG